MILASQSLRVLGSLMEKEMVTPDAYPMSINGLAAAANQRSSRDPVMDLTEDDIRTALDQLETESLVNRARDAGRVTRYEHRIRTVLTLRRDETAVLCLLLLRGPQTPGELRSRSDRMFAFEDPGQVQATLERLAAREKPLAAALPRLPGSREIRWAQLLGGPVQSPAIPPAERNPPDSTSELLRAQIDSLVERVNLLERRLHELEHRTQPDAS